MGRGLLQHTQFLAHLDKGSDTLVEVLAVVAGRNLHTNAGLVLRHNGVVEARYIDTLLLQLGRKADLKPHLDSHHGADGALCRLDVKAGSHHLVAEVVHVLNQLVVNFVALVQHLERFECSTHNGRGNRVREEVRT